MSIRGLLHWPEFMALPPMSNSSHIRSRSPGFMCSLSFCSTHTRAMYTRVYPYTHVHTQTHMCILLQDHVPACPLTALCRDVALWTVRLLTHTHTKSAWAVLTCGLCKSCAGLSAPLPEKCTSQSGPPLAASVQQAGFRLTKAAYHPEYRCLPLPHTS